MRKKYETVSLFATYPKSTTIATTYCTVCGKELSKTDELGTVAKTTIKTFDDLKAADGVKIRINLDSFGRIVSAFPLTE